MWKKTCNCCLWTQEGDRSHTSSDTLIADAFKNRGQAWTLRKFTYHTKEFCHLWIKLSCKSPLLDDTWTPFIEILAVVLMWKRAPARRRGMQVHVMERSTLRLQRGQTNDVKSLGAGTISGIETAAHISAWTEALWPVVFLAEWPVSKYMIDVWHYMGCHLWKYLNEQQMKSELFKRLFDDMVYE